MTVSGKESYTVSYSYDANNRLLTERKTRGLLTDLTTYAYDANGNHLSKTFNGGDGSLSGAGYTYNLFGQLTAATENGQTAAYAYNAQGIRTCKATATSQTYFLLDGGNVVGEHVGSKTVTYLRGANLISRSDGSKKTYYLFNAHGDVTELVSDSSTVTHKYDYDAFGVEKKPDPLDGNPFRYCGEYYDGETKTYYLRARYYDPNIGRFTQQDTHWNTANSIYGDNPQKINEREDKLGLKSYSYAPQITAVMQSGNLYVYGINNPVVFVDSNGHIAFMVITALVGAVIGGIAGAIQSYSKYGEVHWQNVAIGAGIVGAVGLGGGAAVAYLAAGTATASTGTVLAAITVLAKGGTAASLWGISRDGVNQGIRHFFEYATKYPQRIPKIAGKLGCNTFEISKNGFQEFTNALINVTRNYQSMGGLMRQIGQKAIYYYNDVIIIMYDGKLQSAMIGNLKTFLNMK